MKEVSIFLDWIVAVGFSHYKTDAAFGYEPKGKSHFYLPGSPERFTSQEIIDIWSNRANDDLYERWKKAIIHNKENIQKQNNRE